MNRGKEPIYLLCFLLFTSALQAQVDSSYSSQKKVKFTGIPILSYSSPYGTITGLNAMAFFNINAKNDSLSPASQVGLGVGSTPDPSYFGAVFAQLYFSQDRWRITAGLGMGNLNFQYFPASNGVDEGAFVDYKSLTRFIYTKVMRKIAGPFYGGAFINLKHSSTTFVNAPDSTLAVNANGFGVSALFDSRNNIYSPSRGWHISIDYLVNPHWTGSDSSFSALQSYVNFYVRVNKRSVLATRISAAVGFGAVPFTGQHIIGGKDLRGYTEGKYRGNQAYAMQTEYRWNFYRRWGAVGFAGLAFTEQPYSGALPSAGIGIRFLAIRSHHINIGVDGAWGKNDKGIYFRINEAF